MLSLNSFRGQLAVTAVAALSLLALTAILIRDVVVGAEARIVSEAEQQCAAAAEELAQQYQERREFREEDDFDALPFEAKDLSLTALSATVLRGYEGVEGGFLEDGRPLGLAGTSLGSGAAVMSDEERELVALLETTQAARVDDGPDILVGASWNAGGATAWTLKRLPNAGDAVPAQRRWLLGGLALSALLGFGALLSISLQLRRGIENVQHGLERLESDLAYRLPKVGGDLGAVAQSINKMADARDALEKHVGRQERLAALGRVVGGVAHEIRNPLNSMRLTLELLSRRIRKKGDDAAQVDRAVEEVDRLDGILTKLLAFGRPGAEDRRAQPAAPLIEQAIRMAQEPAERRGVRIRFDPAAADGVACEVDAAQIEQVLLNLLLNAVDASGEGDAIDVRLRRDGAAVGIEVTDCGAGIDDAVRERIFDPYFTTKDTGSGLGLAISREIVRRHGGELVFESRPGETTFRLSLPAVKEPAVNEGVGG